MNEERKLGPTREDIPTGPTNSMGFKLLKVEI
jgi:hypothetical protein